MDIISCKERGLRCNVKKTYDKKHVELDPLLLQGFEIASLKRNSKGKYQRLEEVCIEETITQGDEDFINWNEKKSDSDLLFEDFWGSSSKMSYTPHCNGFFCPKCGVFLNEKICTKHEVKQF